GKSGMDVLKEIKSNVETSHIPIIVLTTSDDPAEIEQCYRLGCNAYIIKPVTPDEFKEKMGELGKFLNILSSPSGPAILHINTKPDEKEGDK
ncbi:MAG: response regulator, partial [Proteobacteria bacterium]|nr:response regulator [Pseudomonadota bacterium]